MKVKTNVSEQALVRRLNRFLSDQLEQIEKWRFGDFRGSYRLVDLRLNAVLNNDVDVEGVARRFGVLRPGESVIWA